MKLTKTVSIATAALPLCFFLDPAPAHAAGASASATLSLFSQDDATAAVPLFDLKVPLGESLAIGGKWGVSYLSVGDDSVLKPLNPLVAAYYQMGLGAADLTLGAGVALPVVRVDDVASLAAIVVPIAMHGGWDIWLYAPETLSIVFPGRLDFNVPGIGLAAEAAVGVATDAGDANDDTNVVIQAGGEISLPLLVILDVGAALRAVYVPDVPDDNLQLSAEPFVALEIGPAVARVGLHLNLDEPFGFSFDDGKAWALKAGVGFAL